MEADRLCRTGRALDGREASGTAAAVGRTSLDRGRPGWKGRLEGLRVPVQPHHARARARRGSSPEQE